MEAFAFFGDATDVALYQQNGILNMSNTLISASQTTGGTTSTSCVFNAGTFATNVNNLIEDGTCSPALSGAPGLVDTDLADPDPAETSDNGGPTETIALDAAIPSQAIDAGASGSCLPTDQRGVARTAATCDIGAFEYTAVAAPVPSVTVASASATTLQEGTSVNIPVTVANLTSGQLQVYAVIEGGTASFTDDYTITDMLTFTTNNTQNITLNAITDALAEAGETVSVSFVLAGTADITGNGTQTITIIDPVAPPTFSKAFAPAIISTGGVTTLTYTVNNSANTIAATSLDFTHNLPTDVVVATPANASTTCTGGTLTAGAGTGVITYTGGAVTAGATCTVQADVTASSAGNFTNVTDDLTSSLGNSGTATDTLNVVPPPPFSMAFVPFSITVGNTSTLTHTIDNTASTIDATALDFTHNLPVDILIATPSNASTTCTGGTLTATDGGSVITYTGGTVTAGTTCTVQIDVTTNTIGNFDNTTGDLTSSLGNSGTANATLTVTALPSVGGGGGTSSDTSAGTPPEGFFGGEGGLNIIGTSVNANQTGNSATWQFAIINNTGAPVDGVTARITFPNDDLQGISSTSSLGVNGVFSRGSLLVDYNLGTLPTGTTTFTVETRLPNRAGIFSGTLNASVNGAQVVDSATLSLVTVTALPNTGETPSWAVRLRQLLGGE